MSYKGLTNEDDESTADLLRQLGRPVGAAGDSSGADGQDDVMAMAAKAKAMLSQWDALADDNSANDDEVDTSNTKAKDRADTKSDSNSDDTPDFTPHSSPAKQRHRPGAEDSLHFTPATPAGYADHRTGYNRGASDDRNTSSRGGDGDDDDDVRVDMSDYGGAIELDISTDTDSVSGLLDMQDEDSKTGFRVPAVEAPRIAADGSIMRDGDSDNDDNDVIEEVDRDDEKAARRSKKPLNVSRLLSQAYPERWIILAATVCLFLGAGATLAIPAYVGRIIDALNDADKAEGERRLSAAVINLVIVNIIGAVFSFARGTMFVIAGERVVARMRKQLFRAIISQEIGMFDVTRTGELINRLSSDTSVLKSAVTTNISIGLRWLATILGGIIYLFFLSWKLTLVMLGVIPIIAIGARKYGMFVRGLSKQTQDALAKATEVAEESVSHIRTVRSFAREEFQNGLYGERVDITFDLGKQMGYAYGSFIGVLGLIAGLAVTLVLYYGGRLVLDGEMSAGVLTSFVLYTITVGGAFGGLSGLFGDFMKAIGANERVFQLIDRKPRIPLLKGRKLDPPHPLSLSGDYNYDGSASTSAMAGHIVFDSVSFNYPSRPKDKVLQDFSLELRPGTVTALVGPSGGGKTTVVSLIERFYDPQRGRIMIDGINLSELEPTALHRHIGLVSQEPVLFASTIAENITYGVSEDMLPRNPEDRRTLIRAAAEAANAHEFICGFRQMYDTPVGERGVRLSGGQKQRIAIARAVLMNPRILLLDEATSALDAESEHLVQEALDRLMHGRTTLVIAHRLSTVKTADNVVVLHKGRVVEQGTHDSLLNHSGVYANLVKRQLAS